MTQRTYKTKSGKVLTDSDIEAMADEAERGYDPAQLRPRGRPLMGSAPAPVVPVRMDPELVDAVQARAEVDQTSVSDVIRTALHHYLAS